MIAIEIMIAKMSKANMITMRIAKPLFLRDYNLKMELYMVFYNPIACYTMINIFLKKID